MLHINLPTSHWPENRPNLTSKEPGKCSLPMCPGRRNGIIYLWHCLYYSVKEILCIDITDAWDRGSSLIFLGLCCPVYQLYSLLSNYWFSLKQTLLRISLAEVLGCKSELNFCSNCLNHWPASYTSSHSSGMDLPQMLRLPRELTWWGHGPSPSPTLNPKTNMENVAQNSRGLLAPLRATR